MLTRRAVDVRQRSADQWLNEYVGHFLREAEVKAGQIKIRQVQFRLLRKQATALIHEGSVVEGHIFSFTKSWRYSYA